MQFRNQQYYDLIKEQYDEAERVLSDIISILKSSFDKKYTLDNEYIEKVINMLIDIEPVDHSIKGIFFSVEKYTFYTVTELNQYFTKIKGSVDQLKRYYNAVNWLIERYNKFHPGTIKNTDKDIAKEYQDVKLTLVRITAEMSDMIQKKNEINEINKANDPETHDQKTKDTLDLLQKQVDELEKYRVKVNGHIDKMKEASKIFICKADENHRHC